MDFTIDKVTTDEDGNEITVTENYTANLDGQNASVSKVVDGEAIKIADQPWNPLGDGSRASWASVDEVVTWFKENF